MSAHHARHHHVKKAHALNHSNEAFLRSAVGPAQASEQQTGVPASITIAQAALESGWGHHHIGDANNYFGIKAFPQSGGGLDCGRIAIGYVAVMTREVRDGESKPEVANFRKYRCMTDSFIDHGLFILNNGRFHTALVDYARTGDANAFATGLQRGVYATDPHYADSLIAIMRIHNLHQYNQPRANS